MRRSGLLRHPRIGRSGVRGHSVDPAVATRPPPSSLRDVFRAIESARLYGLRRQTSSRRWMSVVARRLQPSVCGAKRSGFGSGGPVIDADRGSQVSRRLTRLDTHHFVRRQFSRGQQLRPMRALIASVHDTLQWAFHFSAACQRSSRMCAPTRATIWPFLHLEWFRTGSRRRGSRVKFVSVYSSTR